MYYHFRIFLTIIFLDKMDLEVLHERDYTNERIQIRNGNILFSVAIELYI
jgi:hypothetical protein